MAIKWLHIIIIEFAVIDYPCRVVVGLVSLPQSLRTRQGTLWTGCLSVTGNQTNTVTPKGTVTNLSNLHVFGQNLE